MTTTFTISELATEFDVTTRTIRHYEDEGLLNPRREGTNRLFSNRDRVRLKLALRGKRLGFSLAEIRELFNLYDLARDEKQQLQEFMTKLERRREMLEQQREDIEVMLNEITFFENQCRKLLTENQLAGKQPARGRVVGQVVVAERTRGRAGDQRRADYEHERDHGGDRQQGC